MTHIFVDYENVKRMDPGVFALEGATFTLLLGPQNRTFDVGIVEQLISRTGAVELIRLEEPGRNAVDFALAYYLGRKVVVDPTARFYLVSKDSGYDPLISHLRGRGVRLMRIEDFEQVTGVRTGGAVLSVGGAAVEPPTMKQKPAERTEKPMISSPAKVIAKIDLVERVLVHLRKNANSRPRRKQTLSHQLASQFLKGAAVEEVETLIATLEKRGYLEIDPKGGITYRLDEGAS